MSNESRTLGTDQTPSDAAKTGMKTRPVMTTDEIVEKLNEIFRDVQTKIHDQWEWIEASFYVECLRSRAANVCPSCGEAGLGCNQFGCWKAVNAPLPAPPWTEQLLEAVVKELTEEASQFAGITYEQGIAFGAALAKRGVRINYGGTEGNTPGASAQASGIGQDRFRDAANPCSDFSAGTPLPSSSCEGDGHYLCAGCKEKKATGSEDNVSRDTAKGASDAR